MDKSIISSIVNAIDAPKSKGNIAEFSDPSYKPVPLSKGNFHPIGKAEQSSSKIVFIDGGNAEILKSYDFSLQLIRVASVVYSNNKRISSDVKECFVLTKAVKKEDSISYEATFFNIQKGPLSYDSFDSTIRQGKHRIAISAIAGVIRRLMEIELAKEAADKLSKGDIIVLDGDLKTSVTKEKEYLEALFSKVTEKDINLSALSKSSEIYTDTGFSLFSAIEDISPDTQWFYHPLVEARDAPDILIVKLNKNSNFIFKLELLGSKPGEVLKMLADNSRDPVFPGYPYGLIEADKLARVSNSERDYYKTIFLSRLDKAIKIDQNAHSILDRISF